MALRGGPSRGSRTGDLLPVVNDGASRTAPQALGYLPVYGRTCSCGVTLPVDLSNRRTDGWARQPLLLSTEGLGVTVARIFSAALQSLFATNPQLSQTYKPRSTRFESAFVPHSQQVIVKVRFENGGISGPAIDAGLWRSCRIHPAPKGADILLECLEYRRSTV